MNYHLAIDIGASSGRHVIAYLEQDRLMLKEVYRFKNGFHQHDDQLVWSLSYLWDQILLGLKRCSEIGMIPQTLGIDTWGVDFVLLDEAGEQLLPCVAYRDRRTDGMDEVLRQHISEQALYEQTGIQKQIFNTIYQLLYLQRKSPQELSRAKHFLMVPDYFNYLLTGKRANEYTNATTTSLIDVHTGHWHRELIRLIGLSPDMFSEVSRPGQILGRLQPEIVHQIGFDCEVILVPSHDTASAFLAVPMEDEYDTIISSGTWSLLGRELNQPILSQQGYFANFTNEGGYANTYRYLKNIMGLWIIQECHRLLNTDRQYDFIDPMEHGIAWDFTTIEKAAATASDYHGRIDVDSDRYLAPSDMIEEIYSDLVEHAEQKPRTIEDILFSVYASLAESYASNIDLLEQITGKKTRCIHVVGGGSKDTFLNTLTAKTSGLPLKAGPAEATSIGNILVQLITKNEIKSKEDARELVKRSFEIKEVDYASI